MSNVALIGSFVWVYFYLLRLFNFCFAKLIHLCCATIYDGEIKLYINRVIRSVDPSLARSVPWGPNERCPSNRTFNKAMLHCRFRSAHLVRTRLVSAPVVVYDTMQPVRRSRSVSIHKTTQWRHSLKRHRHAPIWCICNTNMTSSIKPEIHNVSQRRQGRTKSRPQEWP